MIPHIKILTEKLPARVAGYTTGPVIWIKPRYKDDRGLIEHELVHVYQWYMWMFPMLILAAVLYPNPSYIYAVAGAIGLAGLVYLLVPKYKLWAEVQAYKEQAKWYPDDRRPLFAKFIAENYKLNISQAEALAKLKE